MKLFIVTSILSFGILPAVAAAQTAENLESKVPAAIKRQRITDNTILSVSHENDMLAGAGDRYYTSGIRFSLLDLNADVPDFIYAIADAVPFMEPNEMTAISYSLGHNLYTPSDITVKAAQPDDRPYAAFLYGSAGLTTLKDDHIDEVEMTLGVIGPAALGEPIQKFIHENISDSPAPQGWDHQLKNEPGLMISAQRRWPKMWETEWGALDVSAGPYAGATLGNIYTYGNGGLTLMISPQSSGWQGMPIRVRPSMPGSGFFALPEDGIDWTLFAGVEGRAMARNIFLDGNTFADSQSVDKEPFVGDANIGVATTLGRARLSYSLVWRSKEFEEQEKNIVFGVVSLGVRY